MKILKSILITVLLITFEVIILIAISELTRKHVPTEYLIHYFSLIHIVPRIITFIIVIKIFKIRFDWKNEKNKLRNIKPNIIFNLLILTLGFELFDRPFFDFNKIVDFINGIEIEPYVQHEKSFISIIYSGISVLIIAPMFEELIFRKYIYTELLKKYSSNLSIFISSILFSLMHLPSYSNLIPTFIFGIICCIIYRKTMNIFYTIILHFFANLSFLILVNYGEIFYKWSFGLEYNLIYWVMSGIGITLILLGMKKITTANTVQN